jgi:hypothetical protein
MTCEATLSVNAVEDSVEPSGQVVTVGDGTGMGNVLN